MVRIDFRRKVGPKGQVVIPQELRRITGIQPNSEVSITLQNTKVVIEKETQEVIKWLEEVVKKDGKPLRIKDMDKWYEDELEDRWKAAK